ncbi:hypothetical protein CRUP_014441 [Coryphaenoides rupestris]|nr:hypothetical protein CRUP_014441 [Coryphaenoides rupestris]
MNARYIISNVNPARGNIDECVVRTHDCGVGLQCKNTDGSFVCSPRHKCLTGFKLDSHGNCIDPSGEG